MPPSKSNFYLNFFLIICILLRIAISTSAFPETMSSSSSSTRRASIRQRNSSSTLSSGALRKNRNPSRSIQDCCRIGLRSGCVSSSSCKWCRSDAVDDFCFSKLEAWRLPSQVFTCDSI